MTPPPSDAVTRLCLDQRHRWLQGERVPVEVYIEENAWLRADPERLLDLIYNEIVLREASGPPPGPEEYLQRFPQFGDQLRIQFAVHWVIEEGSREDSPPSPETSG